MFFKRNFQLFTSVLIILFLLVILVKAAEQESITTYNISGITYVCPLHQQAEPKKVGVFNNLIRPKTLHMEFDFKTSDVIYDNLFQTGNSSSAIRMEIIPPGQLTLIYGGSKTIALLDGIKTGKT